MMRRLYVGVACLLLAACGSKMQERGQDTSAAADNVADGGGVAVTAAPGVAFDYGYSFRMPSQRVAATQEAHAQTCERLGIARCRITGMRYHVSGENDVSGTITFKLLPELARGFGRDGIATVKAADGTLVDATITGTDAAAEIARLGVAQARASADRARLDAELARTGRPAAVRADLEAQRTTANETASAAIDAGTVQAASLASTPVTFTYESGPAVTGFDPSAPIHSAADLAVASVQTTLTVVLAVVAVLGPPAIAAGLMFLAWRAAREAWMRRQRRRADLIPTP
ncbi:hypothetical protein [uncultured Sphingomonas sp.]|uniref:hypothetical protein n=1 Tax=uncultured Sphingomonas sp. TaxID=158754 RepID=UPI0035CB5BBD